MVVCTAVAPAYLKCSHKQAGLDLAQVRKNTAVARPEGLSQHPCGFRGGLGA